MKTLKRKLLLALLLTLVACALCACKPEPPPAEEEPPHTHKWGNWITEITPACDAGGQQVRVCDCGERETQTLDPTGAHILGADNTCTNCGEALQPTGGLEFNALTETTCEVAGIGTADGSTLVIPHTYNGMSVTQIGEEAFRGNTAIKQLILPYTLKYISNYAFADCAAISAVSIPTATISIQQNAFCNCYNLTHVNFGTGAALRTIGSFGFYCTNIQALDFGDNSQLRTIGESAFFGCLQLTSIRFGKNSRLTTVGKYAFNSCSALTFVTLPDTVTSLRQGAFYDCKNLVGIVLPKNLISIEKSAFLLCDSLKTIYYGGTVSEWDAVNIHADVGRHFKEATVYYYSELEMPTGGNVKYWHYLPTPW